VVSLQGNVACCILVLRAPNRTLTGSFPRLTPSKGNEDLDDETMLKMMAAEEFKNEVGRRSRSLPASPLFSLSGIRSALKEGG
jgi:hypothetical protein